MSRWTPLGRALLLALALPSTGAAQLSGPAPLPPGSADTVARGHPLHTDGATRMYTLEDPSLFHELFWTFVEARPAGTADPALVYEGYATDSAIATWRTRAPVPQCGTPLVLRLRVQFQNVDGAPVVPVTAGEVGIRDLPPEHPLLDATGMNTLRVWYRWETERGVPLAEACGAAAAPRASPAFYWRWASEA